MKMKRKGILFAISLFVIALAATLPVQASTMPQLIDKVVKNKEFFAEFTGYEDYRLFDVNRIDEGSIGLVLLDPMGFETRMVFEVASRNAIYEEMIIPEKGKRAEMKNKSMKVADAIRLAKSVLAWGRRPNATHI